MPEENQNDKKSNYTCIHHKNSHTNLSHIEITHDLMAHDHMKILKKKFKILLSTKKMQIQIYT